MQWIEQRRWPEGVAALLPAEPEEVAGVRVWLALCELTRERPELTEIFEHARGREHALLVDAGLGLDELDADLVLAAVEGLRVRLCEPGATVTVDGARTALARLLEHLGRTRAKSA